ncbi:hypothetical protein ACS0TY_012465 [Phlomoides rotata]
MPNVEDRQKLESVRTVVRRGCRYYLEKVFKENLKGGEIYEFSCSWLTGINLTPSPLSAPRTEKVDANDEGYDANDDYSSFFKKVLKENTNGGVVHKFAYSWLTGSKLMPIAVMRKKHGGNNDLLPLHGYRKLFTMVIYENLKGGILHEYFYSKMRVKLSPILPHERPSPITYDHKLSTIKHKLVCHHFVITTGFLNNTILLQPYRLSPNGDDDDVHRH